MIRTTHCRRCGQVLDAFVEFVPGLPLGISQRAVESRLENASCGTPRNAPVAAEDAPRPEPTTEAKPSPDGSVRGGSRCLPSGIGDARQGEPCVTAQRP